MRLTRTTTALGLAVAAALAAIAPAAAVPVQTNVCEGGVKIEDPADGTYEVSLDGSTGSIVLDVNELDNTFSFTSSGALSSWSSVVVKGGPGALTFDFSPAVSAASDLHAPVNAKNGKFPGLSHICFFPGSGTGEEGGGGGEE